MLIRSTAEMVAFGRRYGAKLLKDGRFPYVIELIGDIGTGKTTFTRGLAKGLGVETPLGSPSFTISRLYAGKDCFLAHYDFFRIDDPGLMREDLDESLNDPRTVTVIEWGQSLSGLLPADRTIFEIVCKDEQTREITERRP